MASKDKPKTVNFSIDEPCIRLKLQELAIARVKKYYHSASSTHIFCQDDISIHGIRGVGLFADEAYRNFLSNVDSWALNASDEAVLLSIQRLKDKSPEVRMVKEIQVRVPERIKEAFRELANQEGVSLSSLVVRAIREQIALVEKSGCAKSIVQLDPEKETSEQPKSDLSFRIEQPKLDVLDSVATELDFDSKDLIRNFLFQYYDRHASSAAAG